ncbi:MAG: 1-acyl-sn-glycerol-3-phosphate acyltransferase [Anaerolineae bacterium]|nr:1-acyl-sn-glycerol-3-phosphate acyltransferase [Anaerolineae bacterium]
MKATTAEFYRPYKGVDYTWRRRILRWLLRTFVFTTVVKVEAEGVGQVPATGGTIFMVNHTAFIEPVAVAGVVDREDIVPMSKIENFKIPGISWLVAAWGAFSVRRGKVDRKALRYAAEVLEEGGSILMMPEGTRRPRLKRAYDGIAYMATKTGALIVPVGVDGADRFKWNIQRVRRTTLKMRFGRPFRFRSPENLDEDGRIPRKVLKQMTTEAMYQLALLLPERLRGFYSDLENMTTDYLVFDGPG